MNSAFVENAFSEIAIWVWLGLSVIRHEGVRTGSRNVYFGLVVGDVWVQLRPKTKEHLELLC